MHLKKISLFNYKNFSEANFEFVDKINCFVGQNGIGKTNVLDAIYHLSNGKSYFNPVATQNIKHDADFFVVNGDYLKHNQTPLRHHQPKLDLIWWHTNRGKSWQGGVLLI